MALTLKLRYLYNQYVLNYENQQVFSLVTLASKEGFNPIGWREIPLMSNKDKESLRNSIVITAYADEIGSGNKYTRFKTSAAGQAYGWGNKSISAAEYNNNFAMSNSADGSYRDYNFKATVPTMPSIGDIYSMFLPTIIFLDQNASNHLNLLSEYVSQSQLDYVPMSQPIYMKKRRIVTYIGRDKTGSVKTYWSEVGNSEVSGYNSVDTGYTSTSIVSKPQTFFSDYYTPTIVYDRQVFNVSNSTAISKSDSSVQEAHKALIINLDNFGEIRGERKIANANDFEQFVRLTRGSYHHGDIIGYANYALPFSMYLNQVAWITAAVTDSNNAKYNALADIALGTGSALQTSNYKSRGDAIKINLITDNKKNRILGAKLGLDLSKIIDYDSIFVKDTEQQNGQKLYGNANGGRLYVSTSWSQKQAKDAVYDKLAEAVSSIGLTLGSKTDGSWKLSGQIKKNNLEKEKQSETSSKDQNSGEIILGTADYYDHVAKFEAHAAKDVVYFNGDNLACGYYNKDGKRRAHAISFICDGYDVKSSDEFLLTLKTKTYCKIPRFGGLKKYFRFGNPETGKTNETFISLGTQYYTDLVQENEFQVIIKADRCVKPLKPVFNSDNSYNKVSESAYLMPYSDGKYLGHVLYMPYKTKTLMTSEQYRVIPAGTTVENAELLHFDLHKSFAYSQKHLGFDSLIPIDYDDDPLESEYKIFTSGETDVQTNLFRLEDDLLNIINYKKEPINERLIKYNYLSGGNPNLDSECGLAIQCGLIQNKDFAQKNQLLVIIYRKPFDVPKDNPKFEGVNLNCESEWSSKAFTFTTSAPNEYCLYAIEGEAKIIKLNTYSNTAQNNLISSWSLLNNDAYNTTFDPKKYFSLGFAGSNAFSCENTKISVLALKNILLNYGWDKGRNEWLMRNSKYPNIRLGASDSYDEAKDDEYVKDYKNNTTSIKQKDIKNYVKQVEIYCEKLIENSINIDDTSYVYVGNDYGRTVDININKDKNTDLLVSNRYGNDAWVVIEFDKPQILKQESFSLDSLTTLSLSPNNYLGNTGLMAKIVKTLTVKMGSLEYDGTNLKLKIPGFKQVEGETPIAAFARCYYLPKSGTVNWPFWPDGDKIIYDSDYKYNYETGTWEYNKNVKPTIEYKNNNDLVVMALMLSMITPLNNSSSERTIKIEDKNFKIHYSYTGTRSVIWTSHDFNGNWNITIDNANKNKKYMICCGTPQEFGGSITYINGGSDEAILHNTNQWKDYIPNTKQFEILKTNWKGYLGFYIKEYYGSPSDPEYIGLIDVESDKPTKKVTSILSKNGTNYITINSAGYIEVPNSNTKNQKVSNDDIKNWMFPHLIQNEI